MELLATKKLWLSAGDLAKELSIGKSTVYSLAATGAFGCPLTLTDRRGGALRFHRSCVEKYLRERLDATAADLGIFEE